MITMSDNDSSTPWYEGVKRDLEIDPEKQIESKERLDGIVERARRS